MKKINLHMHSKYSLDAALDINDILNKCFKEGISYLSITDHDTCNTYLDLDKNKIKGNGTLIYGMEADALINNVAYDILCYGFELEKVMKWANMQYETIESRQEKIYKKLIEICKEKKIPLDNSILYNPKKEFAHAAIFRKLNAETSNREFLDKYNINNLSDLYRASTMDKNFPLYMDISFIWPKIETLKKVINENGGKIFLAHPYKYCKGIIVDEVLDSCLPFIDGIEICNEPKNLKEVEYLYKYAKENNLLVSAGSDFHGSKKHNKLEVYLNKDMEKDILDWISKVPGKIII